MSSALRRAVLAARAIWSWTWARRVAASFIRRAIGSAMTANQPPWPRDWLMTDERLGDRLWDAVDRLPAGAGIVFRHYRLSAAERMVLGEALASRATARNL